MEEIVIIGSGIAGYSAAICLNQFLCPYKLISGNYIGGQLNEAPIVSNYPGIESNSNGFNVMENIRKQVNLNENNYINDEVIEVDFSDCKNFKLKLNKNKTILETKSVIIATGKSSNKLNLEKEDKFLGKGISYCAVCDGFLYRNKVICVIGGGDSAIKSAVHLTKFAKEVHIFIRRDKLRANNKSIELINSCNNIIFHYNTIITKILGEEYVEGVEIIENNVENNIKLDGIFVMIGSKPNTEIFEKYINLDKDGYIITDINCETNIKGVFAAGDVQSNTYKQAIIAAGNGYTSATNAYYFLRK